MEVNYLTLVGAAVFLILSLLSVYRPNLVWGKPRAVPDHAGRQRLIRRRQIGTLAYFLVGAVLLVLSFR
ncbi:MAG: hypothetical protein JSV36_02875 [Anaerolineae bacterium]|nr:MAG: hypothetical protein JSV36_02875 [Anaerolineae bacterium]